MPKALKPGKEYPIVLEGDRDQSVPRDQWPTFYAKSTTCYEQMELVEKWDDLKDPASSLSTKAHYSATLELLGELITGWKNMGGHEFSREELGKVLDIQEATELLALAIWNNHIDTDEKKSLEPQH